MQETGPGSQFELQRSLCEAQSSSSPANWENHLFMGLALCVLLLLSCQSRRGGPAGNALSTKSTAAQILLMIPLNKQNDETPMYERLLWVTFGQKH